MFQRVKDTFRALSGQKPLPAPERVEPPPLEDGLTRLMRLSFENDSSPDAVIGLIEATQGHALYHLDPVLKARMMHVLSRALDANPDNDMARGYGMVLAITTTMPDGIFRNLTRFEDRVMAHVEEMTLDAQGRKQQYDPGMALGVNDLDEVLASFTTILANSYEQKGKFAYKVIDDPDYPFLGRAVPDVEAGTVLFECNVAQVRTLGDLPKLLVTLGHEAAHGLAFIAAMAAKKYSEDDFEHLRKTHPDMYVYLALTNKKFYSSQDQEVYRAHPEEIMAERAGLRLGVRVAQAFGLNPTIDQFAESVGLFPSKKLAEELASLFKGQKGADKKDGDKKAGNVRLEDLPKPRGLL